MIWKFALILFLFSACEERATKTKVFRMDHVVIIDTTVVATDFLHPGENTDYPSYYIGAAADTIKIGRLYWSGRTPWRDDERIVSSGKFSDKTLRILVDSNSETNSTVEYMSTDERVVRDSCRNIHAFLFSIQNISDTAIYLGRTFSVYSIHREAKDRRGRWVNVDRSLSEAGICLTGEPTIILKPGEIVISKVRRYKGAFHTEFRLVLKHEKGIVYSNVFRDWIDERSLGENGGR